MNSELGSTRKPATKQDSIVTELRRRIVEGVWAPGARLPIRREIEVQFSASLHTVQKALDRLASDGFVRSRGSQGTFVAELPPHLSRYALVFPAYQANKEQFFPRGWTALTNEAKNLERIGPRKFAIYYGIDGHSDSEDYQRLVHDVQSQRVAGLIFPSFPYGLTNTPLLDLPRTRRATITLEETVPNNMASVRLIGKSMITRALEYFVSRGRRRVAIVSPAQEQIAEFAEAAALRGMEVRPIWMQMVSHYAPEAARRIVHLMMHDGQLVRPDALLIGDDNQVEHATAGLIDAGIAVPGVVDVVTHCNFPWPTNTSVQVKRLGFDSREVLRALVAQIEAQRNGNATPGRIDVGAVFEDELPYPRGEAQEAGGGRGEKAG